jgi:hypothetical protein
MSLVYWFSDGAGHGLTRGGPSGTTPIPTLMVRWIRANGSPDLIVYGGDVYPSGNSDAFMRFFEQMDNDVTLMCETPGNHDWQDDPNMPGVGRIPHGYETFWKAHPESKQPIDETKTRGARYEHFIDLDGWRFLFLDTGDYDNGHPWPDGDQARVTWLTTSLQPGRANVVVAHHSRLSRGRHGDNDRLDPLWRMLFDEHGTPRVAFTLGGHDHNVSVYKPRSRTNPTGAAVAFAAGISIIVNGAGGDGHYSQKGGFAGFVLGIDGTKPDQFADDEHFCVTRINVIDARSADVDLLDFGTRAIGDPVTVPEAHVEIRL